MGKWTPAEYKLLDDGEPMSFDPEDITAIGREECEDETLEQYEQVVTRLYMKDGTYWEVEESYVEAVQVWAAARTNNVNLEWGRTDG